MSNSFKKVHLKHSCHVCFDKILYAHVCLIEDATESIQQTQNHQLFITVLILDTCSSEQLSDFDNDVTCYIYVEESILSKYVCQIP